MWGRVGLVAVLAMGCGAAEGDTAGGPDGAAGGGNGVELVPGGLDISIARADFELYEGHSSYSWYQDSVVTIANGSGSSISVGNALSDQVEWGDTDNESGCITSLIDAEGSPFTIEFVQAGQSIDWFVNVTCNGPYSGTDDKYTYQPSAGVADLVARLPWAPCDSEPCPELDAENPAASVKVLEFPVSVEVRDY